MADADEALDAWHAVDLDQFQVLRRRLHSCQHPDQEQLVVGIRLAPERHPRVFAEPLEPGVFLALAGLQYRLWVGDGSLAQVRDLQKQIADQHGENERLLERNRILEAEVAELKKGTETVEERARHELGMVKDGETLYQLAK